MIDGIKYKIDILRHMALYTTLNDGAKADVVYDTTNDFVNIEQIERTCKERGF